MKTWRYKYDIIVSHAGEDQETVVNELVKALRQYGLRICSSGSHPEFDTACLHNSGHAVVVLSPHYPEEGRTLRELSAILDLETEGKIRVHPFRSQACPYEMARRLRREIQEENGEIPVQKRRLLRDFLSFLLNNIFRLMLCVRPAAGRLSDPGA